MYERATDLLFEIYNVTQNLEQEKALLLRKRAVIITKKITRAIIENNRKMKLKLLNEAKEQLLAVLDDLYEIYQGDQLIGNLIDDYGTQLLKLLNYQFGQMNNYDGH